VPGVWGVPTIAVAIRHTQRLPYARVPLEDVGYRVSMANEKMEDLKGRAKEAAGDLTNDDDLKREGKVDQASSKVKEVVGDVADKVKDAVNRD
jgi:uncharacterized protein YjbJ (UPF0337 family)